MTRRYSPLASLKYDTNFPSGDQAGSRSADPLEAVRFRTSPLSAGIVKTSPRASTTTRLPVGDTPRLVMRAVTSSQCGIIHGKSPTTRIGTTADFPAFGSNRCTCPPCSKTSAPPPAPSVFTSKSVNRVTCVSCLPAWAYDHTFDTPSRSDRK